MKQKLKGDLIMNMKALGIAAVISGAVSIGAAVHSIVMDYKDKRIEKKMTRESEITRNYIADQFQIMMNHNRSMLDKMLEEKSS